MAYSLKKIDLDDKIPYKIIAYSGDHSENLQLILDDFDGELSVRFLIFDYLFKKYQCLIIGYNFGERSYSIDGQDIQNIFDVQGYDLDPDCINEILDEFRELIKID